MSTTTTTTTKETTMKTLTVIEINEPNDEDGTDELVGYGVLIEDDNDYRLSVTISPTRSMAHDHLERLR
jgi:hypothetical protein